MALNWSQTWIMPMSALGQKQTYAAHKNMSALPPKADMCSALAYVRFGPKADMPLFNNFRWREKAGMAVR